MLNTSSINTAKNLAIILSGRNKTLTPVKGSLLEQLSINTLIPPFEAPGRDHYHSPIEVSVHDTFMDNYTEDLSKILTNHLSYARTVVYPKIEKYVQSVENVVSSKAAIAAEDFFTINYVKLDEFYNSQFVVDEILEYTSSSRNFEYVNLENALGLDFNCTSYLAVGDSLVDADIARYTATIGNDKMRGYLTGFKENDIYTKSNFELIESCIVNYLFYRNLAIRTDLQLGKGVVETSSMAVCNRDYFCETLKRQLGLLKTKINSGVLLQHESEVNFSYLSERKFVLNIYEQNFNKAVETGGTLEMIFGWVAKYNNDDITLEDMKTKGYELSTHWNKVRSIYAVHLANTKFDMVNLALKLSLDAAVYSDLSEEDKAIIGTTEAKNVACKKLDAYFLNLDYKDVDNVRDVAIDIIAGIIYAHSGAYSLIKEMVRLKDANDEITIQDAALLSLVKYATDFMLQQVTLS